MRDELKARRKELSSRLLDLTAERAARQAERHTPDCLRARDADSASTPARQRTDERAREAEIASIHAALRRMDRGEYGLCVSCGEAIAKERLDALPFTPHCRTCARPHR